MNTIAHAARFILKPNQAVTITRSVIGHLIVHTLFAAQAPALRRATLSKGGR